MRKQLIRTMVFCAACLALGTQAQTSSGGSSGTSDQPGYPGAAGTQPGTSTKPMAPTGRMAQHGVRASQLTGAQVTSTSGETLGTISDTIINPATGKIDFAIISLSGGAGGGTPGTTGGTPGTTGGTSGTTGGTSGMTGGMAGGKQVAVPWQLLRLSPMGAAAGQAPSFVFAGDTSKLQSAPAFDPSTDLSQPSWRQSVFSYFGVSGGGTATGGAETPGGGGTSGGGTPPGGDSSGGSSTGNP